MEGAEQLRVGMLGELTASYGGEQLDLGGPRQRAVLALLILARGEVVLAERLADSLWGDQPPADTAAALQSYVSHLRRRLQPGSAARSRSAVIASQGRGYAVRLPSTAVDAWHFESLVEQAGTEADPSRICALLREALELWRGPALADYADEPWADAEVARLTELRRVADERLLAARLELGESALLVPRLEAMVAQEPLREERWRLLVLSLYRAQRQADALSALRRARTTLADELGVDPGPALRELEAEVLAQSPSLDLPRQRASAPVATAPHRSDDLIDREREVEAVRAALDDLERGEPGLLLIEGPAGIGKSRLLVEARRLAAERKVRVLTARGSQLEKDFGFGAARQLFEPALTAPEVRQELLGGAASSARGVFDVADGGDHADGSFAVLHGLYWLTVNLTGPGPMMLAIDDVQWCDRASLRVLAYLVRRLDAVPVMVVGTVRTGEEHDDEEVLTDLAHEPAAIVLRPAPLSQEATAGIVSRRLGEHASPLFIAACHRTTSGNPLLLRQLMRALEADGVRPDAAHADMVVALGSRAVSSIVLMRLRRMPAEVIEVARAAAVLGDGAPLPAVAALAALSEPSTASALAVLSRAEIVKDEQPLAFVHPLVRDAVYRDLPAAERELRHERAAQVLLEAGASAEQVAAHLLLAPRRSHQDIVAVLRDAARTAAERGASESAVTYLRRALAERPPVGERRDVLLELGLLESLIDGPSSTEHLCEAYELLDDERTRADVAIAIARTHVFASVPGTATTFAREARSTLSEGLADQRQGLLALERISGFMHGVDGSQWRAQPAPEPVGQGYGARMLAATAAFEMTLDGADRERAVALARFALDGDRLWTVDNGLFWIVAANVRMLADDELGDFWTRAREAAHARGSLFAAMSTSVWQGFWHWRRGELNEALACASVALDQVRMWGGTGVGEAYTRAFQIDCHLDQGDLAAARLVADAALAVPSAGEGSRLLHQAVARVLVTEGRYDEALGALDTAVSPTPIANPVWNPWRSITAETLQGRGRTDEAVALVEEEVALLRRWGAPSYLGCALRLLGELRGGAGLEHLREAVELLAPTPAVVELARARCVLGSSPDVADDEAVPLLEAASEAAHERGAFGIRDRARVALERRGRQPDTRCDEVRWLSATERRILDLSSAGLGIREVAQKLLLTPGMVRAALEAESSRAMP